MGCDIHAYLERKKHGSKEKDKGINYWVNKGDAEVDRNYELFALLADVRNGNGIKPISQPKGEPSDGWENEFSREFKEYLASWEGDAHSLSYLTLAELKNASLDQEFYDESLITEKDKDGKIIGTCAWTNGEHLGVVGNRKLFELWGRSSWNDLIQKLEDIKTSNHTDEDVRIVFFFDN